MRILITGLRGTLAPVLARRLQADGHEVLGWDRVAVDPQDLGAAAGWLASQRVDAIAHLAMGAPEWAALLAAQAGERRLPFVFTSTAMVFHHEPDGPHHPDDERSARDGYGRYKIACEDAIRAAHPGACIARIGWQIDPVQPGNNMLQALDEWQAREGRVAASRTWRPACSFMEDTAAALQGLLERGAGGIAHLDSNAVEGWSFDRIAAALRVAFGREHWRVEAHEDYRHDQRLAGAGAELMPPLSSRLPALLESPV